MIDDLKDAIAHAKEVAENWKSQLVNCVSEEGSYKCLECAKEHEQLAAWLTELQERREADRWNVIHTEADLPNKEGYYLVDCKERVFSIQRLNFSIADHKPYWSGMCKVYAWRPLPKSYTGSEV